MHQIALVLRKHLGYLLLQKSRKLCAAWQQCYLRAMKLYFFYFDVPRIGEVDITDWNCDSEKLENK